MDELESAVVALVERLGAQAEEFRGQIQVTIPAIRNLEACRLLRDEFGFDFLADETAVDYWPQQEPRFHIIYQLRSISKNLILCLRAPVSGIKPSIASIEPLFPNANWHEREIWDMFGVRFEGHSDLRRILMPTDWEGHPLRKDYPLGYEEVQFTFNFEDVARTKLSPKE
jgi:NADH-quinone oxidoreductase subunit C